jgi:hypothetical protein
LECATLRSLSIVHVKNAFKWRRRHVPMGWSAHVPVHPAQAGSSRFRAIPLTCDAFVPI